MQLKTEILSPRSRSISDQYGEHIREFSWSYIVDALPIPSAKGTAKSRARGYSDDFIVQLLHSVIQDLQFAQRNIVRYAFTLETGTDGWRHAHIHLGSISRLMPRDVMIVFQDHRFGKTLVRVWDRQKDKGYYFKSLDPSARDYQDAHWDFNVKWNKKCKQEMAFYRKHLDKRLPEEMFAEKMAA